ncbi:HNH endonuclease [Vreelandella populi]|uniref:HNH endonuclease n=1 Tax=Vreelandella populi TaxID=2498858 RepID=A0A3S0Z0U4_9GAMM|nr:HNH endonuclease [Halomonas populi]RUR48836.1 HNH endonuclease [Halomonas populi]
MEITPLVLRQLLDYDKFSGHLTWRERPPELFSTVGSFKTWNARFSGKRAGRVQTKDNSYRRRTVDVFGKGFLEHRLIWMLVTGHHPPEEIDHINGDGTDNRWENLRASSREENCHNMAMNTRNTSGVTGVGWNKRQKNWSAYCHLKGKYYSLGNFQEIDVAAMEVMEFRAEHGFSARHGL